MDTLEHFKPHKRLVFAIFLQAVSDLKIGSIQERESAIRFLESHGIAFLNAAGIPRPEKKLKEYLSTKQLAA